MSRKNIIEVRNVTMRFGGVTAVSELTMDIPEGSIVGLIGPNGAGKTTAFNVITGFYRPTGGRSGLCGTPNHGHGAAPHMRPRHGQNLSEHPALLQRNRP